MWKRPTRIVGTGMLLLVSLAPGPADAQPDVGAELKKRGDAQFDGSKYAEALELYEKAYAAHPDPSILYNEARALEAMGDYPEALTKLEQFRSLASPALIAKVQGLDTLFAELRPRVATLTVLANVDHGELFVRGKMLGDMGHERTITTRAGTADIEVRAEGFEPARQTLDLHGGAAHVVDLVLARRSVGASVSIASRPAGAQVLLDDRPLGPSPLDARVQPGPHVLLIRKDGYADQRISLSLGASERRILDVPLEERRPVYTRWYFWAGVGVVAAAAVVGTALLIEKPAEKGSFTPQQVRAPLTVAF
jgi:hypothetical protein